MGWVDDVCFIGNPVGILNFCLKRNRFRHVSRSDRPPNEETFIVSLKKPGHGHFVLSHKGAIWDSLEPNRPGVKDYKIDSYRVIV